MLDDRERLRDSNGLLQLLSHYADHATDDREAWLNRVMCFPGAEAADLVRWHGELIAFGWVDQNTGNSGRGSDGVVTACYRITAAGRRALRESRLEAEEPRPAPVLAA